MNINLQSVRNDDLQAENRGLRRLLAQAGLDAAEHEVAERLQRLLLEELHHRVKNTLASVMVIVTNSLRGAESLEKGSHAIESRLLALGRAHDLLLQTNWASASLSAIVKAAIEAYDTRGTGRFLVQGVEVDVGSGAVLSIAMLLNELCTNAVKHGALSTADGHVEITSTLDERTKRFKLAWVEKSGPPVQDPARRGFGTRLINSLARQLQGTASLRFDAAGLVCEFDAPLLAIEAVHLT
jgi:two-component sensor histidine kinase